MKALIPQNGYEQKCRCVQKASQLQNSQRMALSYSLKQQIHADQWKFMLYVHGSFFEQNVLARRRVF